jgi:predicted HNH restriction endonuclease
LELIEPQSVTAWSPDEILAPADLIEGAVRTITVNAYERDPEARDRCIAAHGTDCHGCRMNFGAVYGSIAEGYIHVHHLRPLSEVREAHAVDPVADLRPVCPNCHAVLHRRVPVLSIEELRELIAQQRSTRH